MDNQALEERYNQFGINHLRTTITSGTIIINYFYLNFCEKIVKCVVGINIFKSNCYSTPFSQLVSPSDEALALLIFENNYDKWQHTYYVDKENKQNNIMEDKEMQQQNKKYEFPSLYTGPKKKGFSRKNQGWSERGIRRFNGLMVAVREDQNKHSDVFDKALLDFLKTMKGDKLGQHEILEKANQQKSQAMNDMDAFYSSICPSHPHTNNEDDDSAMEEFECGEQNFI